MSTGQHPKLRVAPEPKVLKPGTVGIVSGEYARYALFPQSLIMLLGHCGELVSHLEWVTGLSVTQNCNELARRTQGDWLWIMADDHVFGPDLLSRLASHDVDVVVPHCLQRTFPYPQVVYEGEESHEVHQLHTNLPEDELVEIYAAGSAGMLIKKHVLDAIGEPWFETFGKQNEDLEFCRKVREAGFKIHCDTGALLGHIGNMIVWPKWLGDDDRWGIRVTAGPGHDLYMRRIGPSGSLSFAASPSAVPA